METRLRQLISLIVLITIFIDCSGQQSYKDFVGIWQDRSAEISDAYLDTYCFYPNKRFDFVPTSYNGLSRVKAIKGVYFIKKDSIIFVPDTLVEMVGGEVFREGYNTLSDSWTICNGKLVARQIKAERQAVTYRISIVKGQKIVYLDEQPFFKISDQVRDR